MLIQQLNIKNLRIFKEIVINPHPHINFIIGKNGTGKTTLLESIYVLARCKSFRTNQFNQLFSKDHKSLTISARLKNNKSQSLQLGLQKSRNTIRVHLNGKKLTRVSDQARTLPVGIITTNIQKLVNDSPDIRRRFINWGMFHVEHGYTQLLTNYNRILNQRNAAIRSGNNSFNIWDKQLIQFGEEIDQKRQCYFDTFNNIFEYLVTDYQDLQNIKLQYRRGWSQHQSLLNLLNESKHNSLYTLYGPHRADLVFLYKNQQAIPYLSNGQQKILAILLVLTQIELIKKITDENPILLVDDVYSELDEENRILIFSTLAQFSIQTFLTSTQKSQMHNQDQDSKVFHVEHGKIT